MEINVIKFCNIKDQIKPAIKNNTTTKQQTKTTNFEPKKKDQKKTNCNPSIKKSFTGFDQ